MSIHVLPLAHGDCPTLICESAEACYFGDWRVDIDPPKQTWIKFCLLYTSPSPRDLSTSRMPSSA